MISGIIDGICEKLASEFGDGCRIYTESVEQGFEEPCFFVQLVSPSSRRLIGRRRFRQNLFAIQYFPSSKDPNAECCAMMDALYIALERIEADGDPLRGTGMRGELTDGVLSFFVNYDIYAVMREETAQMEVLENPNIETKG